MFFGNKISIMGDEYPDSKIESVNVLLVESMTGAELEYDTLEARIYSESLLQYKYGQPVFYHHIPDHLVAPGENRQTGSLVGKFFLQKCYRVGKNLYSISCVSGVGLLGKSKHYGGLYSTGTDTFAAVVADIIGDITAYTIDETIAKQKVYGWLPVATRRENLHQVLFAMGAAIKKDKNGDLFITVLNSTTAKNIPDSKIYLGGSVEYPEAVTKVSVLEHAYLNKGTDDEQTTLYEGAVVLPESPFVSPKGASVTGMVVEFSEPMHDLSVDAGEILESGANYAIVTATGSIVLTGHKYTHTTVERFKGDENADEDNTVTVKEATLVSRANSNNVVERLFSYYTSTKVIKMDILPEEVKINGFAYYDPDSHEFVYVYVYDVTRIGAGDAVSFDDPYDEATTGIISELSLVGSHILKGAAKIISGYAPTWGNDYTDVIVVTSSQSVTLPADANKCRAVMIGGGHGGGCGGTGGAGATAGGKYKAGGIGGVGGEAGEGGKIIEPIIGEGCGGITFDCVIGTGGTGGTSSNPNGNAGTNTTMSYTKNGKTVSLTTADGTPSYNGFQDFLSPVNIYGSRGVSGQAGAKGGGSDGDAGSVIYGDVTYTGGAKKSDSQQEFEGSGGNGTIVNNVRWTNNTPAIYLTVDYTTSGNSTTFNVTVDKPSSYYEYTMHIKITLGGTSKTISLQGDKSSAWTSLTGSCTISGSGNCTVTMKASGGDRTSEVTMGSGNISASQPYTRTYHYGYGSGAVVAANGANATSLNGAAGVKATVAGAAATVRGCGGNGGNGGSGGGAGGYTQDSDDGSVKNYAGGAGGAGSNGGAGADGIILIYYGKDV